VSVDITTCKSVDITTCKSVDITTCKSVDNVCKSCTLVVKMISSLQMVPQHEISVQRVGDNEFGVQDVMRDGFKVVKSEFNKHPLQDRLQKVYCVKIVVDYSTTTSLHNVTKYIWYWIYSFFTNARVFTFCTVL
jgi:hypothetical protein